MPQRMCTTVFFCLYLWWLFQEEFWSAYLTARQNDRRMSVDVNRSSGGTFNDGSARPPVYEDAKRDFEKLWLEATFGALYSHLFWAAWALIQTQISSIRFGFSVSSSHDYKFADCHHCFYPHHYSFPSTRLSPFSGVDRSYWLHCTAG